MHNSNQIKVCLISTVHNALDPRIFYREAISLRKAGYQVTYISVHHRSEMIEGINIIPLPRIRRAFRPILWGKVIQLASSINASIFQIEDPELLFISPFLRIFTGKPVIYDILESTADFIAIKEDIPLIIRNFLSWMFRWLEPFLARFHDGLLFADDQIAKDFQFINCPKATLYNFPLNSFLEIAINSPHGHSNQNPIILYLGGLKRARGVSLMLEAFQKIQEVIPNAILYLVGPFSPPSLESEVRSEIEQKKITASVIITGPVPFTQIGEFLTMASVGWIPFSPIPKYQKNIPTKLFEYMAYAVPVVSSDLLSVQPFIVHNKTGLLVPPTDPSAHAKAINELLLDSSRAESIGRNGQNEVNDHYHWSEMETRLYKIYEEVLAAKM